MMTRMFLLVVCTAALVTSALFRQAAVSRNWGSFRSSSRSWPVDGSGTRRYGTRVIFYTYRRCLLIP